MASCCCHQTLDYYWRDYHGVVPEDAIPGGEDISGGHIYIGQVYMHDHGLFVAPIFPGKREVEFPCYGPKKANKVIKILCTHNKDNFSWLSTGATTLHLDTTGRHPVLGGYDGKTDGNNVIGRIMYEGITKIGVIPSFNVGNALFHYFHNNQQKDVNSYEVLIYEKSPCDLCLKKK